MSFWDKKRIPAFLLTVLFLVGAIFYIGFRVGSDRGSAVLSAPEATSTDLNANTNILWEAVKMVKDNYYGIKDVSDKDILYGAVKGIFGSLGDPYSVFFTPADSQKFNDDLNGNFGGVGMEIGIRNDQIVVIAPLKGNPAEAVGLKAGDQILKVNGTSTSGMDVDSAVKLIRGDVGTVVTLSIFRDGWKAPKDFKITRANVQVPTLDWEMKNGNIAYIQLYSFNANAGSLFYNAALSASIQGAKGIVLDLRNDPGGYLDTAVEIAGWFVDRGAVVVKEDFRSGDENVMRAAGPAALVSLPVVVLVNGGSASASEILAGALQDDRGAKLIGEKTFGKGSVQEILDFSDGSSAKISIAEWLTPKGRQINKKGIEPDIEVKVDPNSTSTTDIQLNKALEVIKQEMAK
ncbi:MAG: S41 family peptidase [Minisyncoccia bacterium]|jgi:carboxyl-terminal processing protease